MKAEVHCLRVNVKSLAAEARFIRQEMRRTKNVSAKRDLAIHRSLRLKPEARRAHLALAFVKGVPYKVVENKTQEAPAVKSVLEKIKRFKWEVTEDDVKTWLNS